MSTDNMRQRDKMRLIWILALGSFAIGTDTFVVAGILPQIGDDLGVSVVQGGQLVTVFAVTFGLFAPVLAAATANVPRRRLLLTALAIFAVSNIAGALAPTYEVLMATRVLAAIGACMYTPVAAASAAMLAAEEQRGRALAIVLGGTTAATVLGVPVAIFVGNALSWQATFGLVATMAAIVLVVLSVSLPSLPTPPVASLGDRLGVLTDRQVLTVIVTTLLFFLGGFTVYTYIAHILAINAGIDGTALTWLLLVFGVFGVVGNTLGGRLTDRFGPDRVLLVGLLCFAAALLAFPFASKSFAGAAAAMALWALSAWSLTVPQQHRLVGLAPQVAMVAIGLNSSAVFLGIGLSGALGGWAMGQVSVLQLGYVGGAVVLSAWLIALVQIVLNRQQKRTADPAPVG